MSNQSGISVSPALADEFPAFVRSDDVAAVLNIDHAREHVVLTSRVQGKLDDVQRHLRQAASGPPRASYIALRLPGDDDGFAFVQFMPDTAPLSSKMKYASSHATIHKQLGGSALFTTTIFWTNLDEVSDQGLAAHRDHEQAPAPMTEEEASLASAIRTQGTRGSSVAGQSTLAIHANVTDDAANRLRNHLDDGTAVVLRVNAEENESIDVVEVLPVATLAAHFESVREPRYVVGKTNGKIFFAVTSPRETSIKQRMLFASTRISFLEYLKTFLTIGAQIETFEPEVDLKPGALTAEVDPENEQKPSDAGSGTSAAKPKFSRPRPPKRR